MTFSYCGWGSNGEGIDSFEFLVFNFELEVSLRHFGCAQDKPGAKHKKLRQSELLYMDSAIYKGCDYYNYEHNHGKLKQPIITHQNFRSVILFGSF